MAASRKLQGEIERCLKKVTEGVETFDDIWQKVHNAANSNQKEKYEADLKKEIKKLQRLRDQIKSWIASAEIKDKSNLLEYRKLIETQMERFKIVERETKTKAYSKEGLGAAQKLDPAKKEKEEIITWLVQAIDALNLQVDQFESEIESLVAGCKKKRVDKDKQDHVDELKSKVGKHRFHIKKLETILRMLDNMSVEANQVKKIKEDIEYYIESSQDADFQENEYLYDDIEGIDDVELTGLTVAGSTNTDSNGSSNSVTSSPTQTSPLFQQPILQPLMNYTISCSTTITALSEEKKEKPSRSTPVNTTCSNTVSVNLLLKPIPMRGSSAGTVSSVSSSTISIPNTTPSSKQNSSPHLSSTNWSTTIAPSTMLNIPSIVSVTRHQSSKSLYVHDVTQSISSSGSTPQPTGNFVMVAAVNVLQHSTISTSYSNKITTGHVPMENGLPSPHPSSTVSNVDMSNTNSNMSGMQNYIKQLNVNHIPSSPSLSVNSGLSPVPTNTTPTHLEPISSNVFKSIAQIQDSVDKIMLDSQHKDTSRSLSNNREIMTSEIHIPPILGVAPLGLIPLTSEQQVSFRIMEVGSNHMPHPTDSERLRPYMPRNPCTTPVYYPKAPPTNADTIDYHLKLATDTLFFVFYYSESTKSQYLAAKALKKQSWRFHTKYMMWFQRHEEPRTINEEYEQGTYIYFDYEKWTQRKKEGFTFEYKYLEDRDLT